MQNRFVAAEFAGLSPLERLVRRSRLIGQEENLVLWGGGNTSSKMIETDPWGRERTVLRIKGSGADLKAVTAKNFSGLYLDLLAPLLARAEMDDAAMVEFISRCFVEPNAPRPSIETLLHGFVPHACVDHSHADACLALTNTPRREALAREVWGDRFIWIPYQRPGFALSKAVGLAVRARPGADAVVLENHGLITFGANDEESYARHIDYISRAEAWLLAQHEKSLKNTRATGIADTVPSLLPVEARHALACALLPKLRGALGGSESGPAKSPRSRVILRFSPPEGDERLAELLAHPNLAAFNDAGPATPDHTLHVRGRFCLVAAPDFSSPESLLRSVLAALDEFRADYAQYFFVHQDDAQGACNPDPRVILIPGLGVITAGATARAARVAADIVRHWAAIVLDAEAAGGYCSLSPAQKFSVEYWPLELYKLSLAPKEKTLARQVILITGAAGAIGRGVARRLLQEDACLILLDREAGELFTLAEELDAPERILTAAADLTKADEFDAAIQGAVRRFGGIDAAVSCAGTGASAPLTELTEAAWDRAFAVNAGGHFRLTRALLRLFAAQATGGNLVFVASKNVFAPGREFAAYSASKAAQVQLARVAAMEGAAFGVRVNVINPDAVFAGSKLWAEIGPGRAAAHGIAPEELESFYAARNLLKAVVTAADVAEAALWLLSDASGKTTGAVIPVDGGLPEAFPR